MNTHDKILLVMPDKHLGNFVIALNAIKPLRDYYGADRVAIVFDETHRDIVTNNIGLENIIFYPRKILESQTSWLKRFFTYRQFIQAIRNFKPTVSAALEACNVSAFISYLSGAKRRIGLDANKLPYLLNEKIPFRRNVHRLESYFDVMAALDLPRTSSLISLNASLSDDETVKQVFAEEHISLQKPLICIHTGAGKPHKQWPIEHFSALATALMATGKYDIVLTGGHAEREQNQIVLSQCQQKIHDLACRLSVSQLIPLFKHAALLISNDSGPMHIAALSGTRVLALFGPTDEQVWHPLSKEAIVLLGGTNCTNHCNDKYRETITRCFCELPVEKVLHSVKDILNGK